MKKSRSNAVLGNAVEMLVLEQRVMFSAAHHHHLLHVKHVINTSSSGGVVSKPSSNLVAPSGLTAGMLNQSVNLAWSDNTSAATGYFVLRSTNGSMFSQLAKISSSSASSYTDSSVSGGQTYYYEIQAYNAKQTSTVSNKATITTPIVAPSAPKTLSASLAGAWVNLTWSNSDSSTAGYQVFRSSDGVSFSQIGQVNSGGTTTYQDTTVSLGLTYSYEVFAFNNAGTSPASNVASITLPNASSSDSVSISTRFSDELVINATGANDTISLDESGSTLSITANGQTYTEPVPDAGVFIYTRGGSDGISISQGVSVHTTLESIDGASTAITSSGSNVSAWIDSTDTFSGSGTLHKVSSFAGGVSKATGASLLNPTDSGSVSPVNMSLFGTGPVAGDVNQGYIGDCYFLSSLAAFAGTKPSVLTESAVDMGDGTFTVQYHSGSTLSYVRVSNQMPSGGSYFARPGPDQTMWALVMEKAFCYFRTGGNTYSSIDGGWMSEVYSDLGVSNSSFGTSGYSESSLYNLLSGDLDKNEAVTFATSTSAPNLVSNHAYTLVGVSIDSTGVTHYIVRNPWGISGDGLEDSQGYATLTYSQLVANFTMGTQATA
jgi:hypothetical protein